MDEIYLKTDTEYFVKMLWSDNEPADPDTATGVIGIYSYDKDGNEYDGGELDVTDHNGDLHAYIDECLNFIGIEWSSYDEIDEETFEKSVNDY